MKEPKQRQARVGFQWEFGTPWEGRRWVKVGEGGNARDIACTSAELELRVQQHESGELAVGMLILSMKPENGPEVGLYRALTDDDCDQLSTLFFRMHQAIRGFRRGEVLV